MKRLGLLVFLFSVVNFSWAFSWFGEHQCREPGYYCLKVKRGDSWAQLFPKEEDRNKVKKVNRTNGFLEPEMILAVPEHLSKVTLAELAPVPHYRAVLGEKQILINLRLLAFGAYDSQGKLVRWGAISPGTKTCIGAAVDCSTPTGVFQILRKSGAECISNTFPLHMDGSRGGGEMPYCMFFFKGYALHGSSELPGYPASSGCVRLDIADAKWLNEQFIELPAQGKKGTAIIIKPN
ncbi:MAG: L,D-transpeptidase [Legionella sp.]|nr:L,D-transpeptidase [Legionella sp.]